MRIQHNIMAMNAYRNYNTNTSALSKNLEKLASGYKINRAGDDAAGLAISEKMRAQITGLNAAQKNVKDGISLVKTAEGAMQEIQDMLNRMDYLATQSANGTYDDPVDRLNLNKEMDALKEEINRIAESANFNGIALLDGSLDEGATAAANTEALAKAGTAVEVTPGKDHEASNTTQKLKFSVDFTSLKFENASSGAETVTVMFNGATFTASVGAGTVASGSALALGAGGNSVTIQGIKFNITGSAGKFTFEAVSNPTETVSFGSTNTLASAEVNSGANANANITANQGESIKAHIDRPEVVGGLTKLAQGTFDLDADMVKDGTKLVIGDTTYTFAAGDANGVSGKTVTLDKSLFNADGELDASGLNTAAALLSAAAKDQGDFIVTNKINSATIELTERVDAETTSSRYKDYDLVGENKTAGSSADAEWTNVVSYTTKEAAETASKTVGSGKLVLQIGDTADDFNRLEVNVGDMHTTAMGTDGGKSIADIDIKTAETAKDAIDVIKDAINYVSGVRGDLGAIQNRLEHTSNNLSVMAENIQDAESTIRDTDVAEEMMAYTKNNILVQSAQAMLAQANAVPQGVLQLLG